MKPSSEKRPAEEGEPGPSTDPMEISQPIKKQKRGRRRIADINAELEKSNPEKGSGPESNRKSGRMSLRPNRKVNVKMKYRQGYESLTRSSTNPDSDEEAVNDIAEVLDGDFSADYVPKIPKESGEEGKKDPNDDIERETNEVMTENDFTDATSMVPNRRYGRRKINLAPSTSKSSKEEKDAGLKDEPYETFKEQICVVCAKELDLEGIEELHNIYTDNSSNGSNLYDVFRALVKQDIQSTFYGSKICSKCYGHINHVESLYQQYRRATENFLDIFMLGQKILDSDVCSASNIQDGDENISQFVNIANSTIKLIDFNNFGTFNALAYDFQIPIEKLYKASIIPSDEIPIEEAPADTGDGLITLMFDTNTGIIEKAINISVAETTEEDMDLSLPQIYMTSEEFDSIKKSMAAGKIYIGLEDFRKIESKLILGHRIKHQVMLSRQVAEEYRRQIPGAEAPFICNDCHCSFHFFHMLSNHVQTVHKDSNLDDPDAVKSFSRPEIISLGGGPHSKRTGEEASLDKPFQCEHCDKCFTEYLTLSAHVDHYHGFSRTCNVEGCEDTFKSIQLFAQHYVRHADPNFVVPSDFKEKTKCVLPCPLCNINIQGVWKYFTHTFTHDKEPRFKCPVCGKRTHKVQNFKDHLMRHRGTTFKDKPCPYCDKEFFSGDLPRHIKSAHPNVQQPERGESNSAQYYCEECGKLFNALSKYKYHKEMHIPKENWMYACDGCDNTFPSLSRLKLHVANVHNNVNSECSICNKSFQNKHSLQTHLKEFHSSEVALFQCMVCYVRDYTLLAARKHFRLEHRQRQYRCLICKTNLSKEHELHLHLTSVHSDIVGKGPATNDSTEYPCTFCRKLFVNASLRLRHIRFMHLTVEYSQSIEAASKTPEEVTELLEDHIAELEKDSGNLVRLHPIP